MFRSLRFDNIKEDESNEFNERKRVFIFFTQESIVKHFSNFAFSFRYNLFFKRLDIKLS